MAWISKIFGRTQADNEVSNPTGKKLRVVDIAGVSIIRELNFSGSHYLSNDKRVRLITSDCDVNGNGGYRLHGNGQYLVLKDDVVVHRGELMRPWSGCASNSGHTIVVELGFGDTATCQIHVFSPSGDLILTQQGANTWSVLGISDCGRFGAFSTVGPTCELNLVDINRAKVTECFRLEPGDPQKIEFEEEFIRLHYRNLKNDSFRISYTGEFIDREKWISAMTKHSDLDFASTLLADDRRPQERNQQDARLIANNWFNLDHN